MIQRYSSRYHKLDHSFLTQRLHNARAYDRIAGYFSSSILEVAGEAIETMEGCVRIVCNSGLDPRDVDTASAAQGAIRREWCAFQPEDFAPQDMHRFQKLYDLLKSGKMQVKVIPNQIFGLVHGKAGVITLQNGKKTSFLGSVNESYSGWKLNYELFWEDDSPEAVDWVQAEFNYFWNSPYAVPLSQFVVDDIYRVTNRNVITGVADWRKEAGPAETVIEAPVYRQELGLWEHQKFFVDIAFRAHKTRSGARFVLADQVGLGKTVQLALAAQLMALYGDKPVLIIAPKTLLWQWQDEMNSLLDMPSAVWNGKEWIDESGLRYPSAGPAYIKKCPRRVGIISQGLITAQSEAVNYLLSIDYECVIVDEAHRARRKNLGRGKEKQSADPTHLLRFLLELSRKTQSMLLATATPVQTYPIEAWDLLNILSQSNDSVMGSKLSKWRKESARALDLVMGKENLDFFNYENWEWIRNPFPPATENQRTFGRFRKQLNLADDDYVIPSDAYRKMSKHEQSRVGIIIDDNFFIEHNPFIRTIVRRTRAYLENTTNPETGEPYLKKVEVKLHGDAAEDAIVLPSYLQEAYKYAEGFSSLLQQRIQSGGFLKTLLLKRMGSTMIAGKNTAEKMLLNWSNIATDEDAFENEELPVAEAEKGIKNLTPEEQDYLEKLIKTLEINKDWDPKYQLVHQLLVEEGWIERGCIIFSQYYDSAYWVAKNLSADLPQEMIGLYAGGDKSGLFLDGVYQRQSKEEIKHMVRERELRVLLGTDAASEGLNLQSLGSLINLDLPWNPTRLEQRKGRIQRIGQVLDEVHIFNMRYKDSVEDRVHELLSERLQDIHDMFGQLPDVLEDVWIKVALEEKEEAIRIIDEIPKRHPFEIRYKIGVGKIDWESCTNVLDKTEKRKYLMYGWDGKQ